MPDTGNSDIMPIATEDATWTDTLIHGKADGGEEVIVFPITRYENILGAPKVITDLETFPGAPLFYLQTDEVELDEADVEAMVGVAFTTM